MDAMPVGAAVPGAARDVDLVNAVAPTGVTVTAHVSSGLTRPEREIECAVAAALMALPAGVIVRVAVNEAVPVEATKICMPLRAAVKPEPEALKSFVRSPTTVPSPWTATTV